MAVRPEVRTFVESGPLPEEDNATETDIDRRHDELALIDPPVSQEEAALLLTGFGPDESFGLAWTLLHLIETAPIPPVSTLPDGANEWIKRLWERAHKSH